MFKGILRSIRSKLVCISMASLSICATLVFYFSLNEHRNLYRDSVESNLDALGANMADNLLLTMAGDYDEFSVSAELLQFERYPYIVYALVYDKQWKIINQYIRTQGLDAHDANDMTPEFDIEGLPLATSVLGSKLVNLSPIGERQFPEGFLLVVQDFVGPLEESRKSFFRRVLPFVLLTISISTFLALWLGKKFLEPLIKLSQFTRKVEETQNYQLHCQIEGNDEIAELAKDINQLLKTIDRENKINSEQKLKLLQQRESMRQMAEYDILTNLPNRSSFMQELQKKLGECKAAGTDLGVLFFDVDSFKDINDSFGHEIGDELLITVGQYVKGCLGENDVLARLGGDEFLVLVPEFAGQYASVDMAKKILGLLEKPCLLQGWEISVCVSIGIAYAQEVDYDKSQLVANADLAMYHSKEHGKGNYTEFQPTMLEHSRRRTKIANLISSALNQNEFNINYQLKISSEGKINGAEALLRWTSAELGFISPGEFIPIAEKSGKIQEITRWVINRVFQDLSSLSNLCGSDFVVSLNISSQDLDDQNFIDVIHRAIALHGVDITKVQFEITESSYLDNFDKANQFFSEIAKIGGSIALDDFGTGYSSLSYLTKISIDTLKIDRLFIKQLGTSEKDTAVLQAILELAHRLGLKTCSEGIETPEQAEYLVAQGCDQLQGFFFARPRCLDDISIEYLEEVKSKISVLKVPEEWIHGGSVYAKKPKRLPH